MRVLLVSNQVPNSLGVGNPIIKRMKDTLAANSRIEHVEFFPFYNSYETIIKLRSASKNYDIVHVHFGGLYALIIWCLLIGRKTKKYITFHGTDIHARAIKTTKSKVQKLKIWLNQKASFLSILLFHRCGFVSGDMIKYVPSVITKWATQKMFIQNLGVDYSIFKTIDKTIAQEHLGLLPGRYVLFSDVSNTNIKRRDIAEEIVKKLDNDYQLLIMTGVKPDEVPNYINASDFAILTSDEEGSPNIIREVLSLNKPFFSVDVGDASKQLKGLHNSSIISRDPKLASEQIKKYLDKNYIDNTRESMRNILDFALINEAVVDLYETDATAK